MIRLIFPLIFLITITYTSFSFSVFYGHGLQASFLLSLGIFLAIRLYWRGDKSANYTLKWLGGIAMGSLSIAFFAISIAWIAKIAGASIAHIQVALSIFLPICIALAFTLNRLAPTVRKHRLKLAHLAHPITVVHLTDIHVNGIKPLSWFKDLVERVNTLDADYIVFTGDFLDIPLNYMQDILDCLKQLTAKKGKFAVSGNHDAYSGYHNFITAMKTIDFEVIDNKVADCKSHYFLGFPDKDCSRSGIHRVSIEELSKSLTEKKAKIVLDHRPDYFEKNSDYLHLQLSGHTHGGQLLPFNFIVRAYYRFSIGLYYFNKAIIYISYGTGTWGPPMRLFGRGEIGFFELE